MKGQNFPFSPAAAILASLGFAVWAAFLPTISSAFCALALAALTVLYFRPSAKLFLKRLIQINFFVACIWLFTPWTTPGTPLWSASPFTYEGVRLSVLVTLKANALFAVFYCLVSSLSFTELAAGLQKLKMPAKLTAMILLTARGISVFKEEVSRCIQAAKLRGFEMKSDKKTYRTMGALVASVFVRALKRAAVLQNAMDLRGFDGRIRTIRSARWALKDSFLAALFWAAGFGLFLFGLLGA